MPSASAKSGSVRESTRFACVRLLLGVAIGCAGLSASRRGEAGDWPQILGPNRNGVAVDERLAEKWAAGQPATVWQRAVGRGFAGAAISGGRAVIFHRQGKEEIVESLELSTGKTQWRTPLPARFEGDIFPDENGPLCVPMIHGAQVLLYGAGGDLHSLRLSDGHPQWSRSLYQEFRNRDGTIDFGYFGAGSSPIVVGDRVLVNAGGHGAGIVALSLDSGKTLWQATNEDASYSSPVATTIDGHPCVVFVTRLNCVGIDPATGKVLFRFPFGQRGPTVNAASPVVVDGQLFVSSCYGVGAALLRLGPHGPQRQWVSDDVLSNHYSTSLVIDGNLYGLHGRTDGGSAALRCVTLSSGKVRWSQDDFGPAALIQADGKLLAMGVNGELTMLAPSPDGFHRLASAKVLDEPARALPALSGGYLVVRDTKQMKCLRLPAR